MPTLERVYTQAVAPHSHAHGLGALPGLDPQAGAAVSRVLWVTGALNLLVLLAKLWVGLATGALSVFADALHSGGDLANNVIGLLIVRLSHQPPDRDHPYGHRKFESLAVFGLAMLLTALAFELFSSALGGRAGPPPESSPVAIGTMLAVLCVNVAVTWWEHREGKRLQSSLLQADARHTLSDVLVTVAVIAGWQLAAFGLAWADRVAAAGVALAVCVIAYGLFRDAVPILVDAAALEADDVRAAALGVDGVRSVPEVRSRWIGSSAAVELTIRVAAELSTEDAHRIADAVESALGAALGVRDITIHVEPERGA
jgi:cation diffusion facilitator family transporter